MIFYAGGRGLVRDREEAIMLKLKVSRMVSFYRFGKGDFKNVINCLKSLLAGDRQKGR